MHRSFDSVLEEFAPLIREIAEYGQAIGIKTMIENHGYVFQDCVRVEKTYNAVNHKNFGLLIDIGNFMCADEDNVRCVSNLANLAFHVHLKDMVKVDYYSPYSKDDCFMTRSANYLRGVAVGDGVCVAFVSGKPELSVGSVEDPAGSVPLLWKSAGVGVAGVEITGTLVGVFIAGSGRAIFNRLQPPRQQVALSNINIKIEFLFFNIIFLDSMTNEKYHLYVYTTKNSNVQIKK
jgi:hypothetical protein